ncbi:hypothetical protein os1_01200 [Comamonadaceae bacterium OS-1]|nr:hypothetical protein os1_01200 [Comamonadaceae bacterium OS-1]
MNDAILPASPNMPPGIAPAYAQSSTPSVSAVSWAAIVAGAAGAAALSLILLILGVGLGLSSVSPWSGQGATASTFGISTIVWLAFTQLAAAGLGGYLAGRLRMRWAAVHTDEVYFRDTAHGFLAWALATLVTAAMLTSAIGGIVNGAASTAANAVPALAAAAKSDGGFVDQGYFVDGLFRKNMGAAAAPDAAASAPTQATQEEVVSSSAEVGRILASAMVKGQLPADDAKYVGQLVAQRTGLPQADADKRVADVFARVQASAKDLEATTRSAADKARKASAYSALWLFVSLLMGAFIASLAATFGGRQRDLF